MGCQAQGFLFLFLSLSSIPLLLLSNVQGKGEKAWKETGGQRNKSLYMHICMHIYTCVCMCLWVCELNGRLFKSTLRPKMINKTNIVTLLWSLYLNTEQDSICKNILCIHVSTLFKVLYLCNMTFQSLKAAVANCLWLVTYQNC